MTYRSMAKTAPDKTQDLDQKNPENTQAQSVQSTDMHTKTHWKVHSAEEGEFKCGNEIRKQI